MKCIIFTVHSKKHYVTHGITEDGRRVGLNVKTDKNESIEGVVSDATRLGYYPELIDGDPKENRAVQNVLLAWAITQIFHLTESSHD